VTLNSIGDQARAFALSNATNRTKTVLATLTEELASGQVADPGQRLGGNTRALNEIEGRIGLTRQLNQNASEAAIRLQAVQDMFEGIRATTSDLGIALSTDMFVDGSLLVGTSLAQAVEGFDMAVNRLNGANSNRFMLSGDASGTVPLEASALIMDRLVALTVGMTSADQISQAIRDWFDAPAGGGGYLDEAYRGSLGPAQRIVVADGISIAMVTNGATPAVRDLLAGLATAAIIQRGVLSGDQGERGRLLTLAGNRLTSADSAILGEMARIGIAQNTVERAQASNGAALSTLDLARNDLLRADPYETSAALTEVKATLDTIYAVTARLSKLKLVDFLR